MLTPSEYRYFYASHRQRGLLMLSEAERNDAIATLIEAGRTRKQAVQPSVTWPDITIEDAYAISRAVAERRVAKGGRIVGHKVGLTSKAMQRSSKIDEPD